MEQHRCMGCMGITENAVCEKCGWPMDKNNEPHQLPVGYMLRGQYIIGRVLGQGGFGITYLGWDTYLDLPVAIKEFYPNTMVNRECSVTTKVHCYTEQATPQYVMSKERFLREAKALARFEKEPAIVKIKGFFEENDTAYIVMEYIRGTTLAAYVKMRGGMLHPEETFRILRPVMEALVAVHNVDLVHRDISPDNIMLHPEGGAKLLDFGAVRSVEGAETGKDLDRSTEAILKHGFAPIEQYRSRGDLGPWTDEYALCATIWFCLTGKIPEDAPARMMEDVEIDWDIPGLSDRQKAVLQKGFSPRSRDRYGSVDLLLNGLFSEKEDAVLFPSSSQQNNSVGDTRKGRNDPELSAHQKNYQRPKKRGRVAVWITLLVTLLAAVAAILIPNGWKKEDDTHYYYSMGKQMRDAWLTEDGQWFHFGSDGSMDTGWTVVDGLQYYFGSNGVRVTGWADIQGKNFYFGEDGIMITGMRQIGESTFLFGENGAMVTGWVEYDERRLYFDERGAMAIGWTGIEDDRYYFLSDGNMTKGWQEIDGEVFYFSETGELQTGKQKIDSDTYFFGTDGSMKTGWQLIDGTTYYFDADGTMRTGWLTEGETKYFLNGDGSLHVGWKSIAGSKYYFGEDGVLQTGWLAIGDDVFYLGTEGKMACAWRTIDGEKYYFGTDGKMRRGAHVINGRWYFFDDSGRLK